MSAVVYWGGLWWLLALLCFAGAVAAVHAPNDVNLIALGLFFWTLGGFGLIPWRRTL
jgi:hypothetical protein